MRPKMLELLVDKTQTQTRTRHGTDMDTAVAVIVTISNATCDVILQLVLYRDITVGVTCSITGGVIVHTCIVELLLMVHRQ